MKTEELRYLVTAVMMMMKHGKEAILDLFDQNDADSWLDRCGIRRCDWLKQRAEKALAKMHEALAVTDGVSDADKFYWWREVVVGPDMIGKHVKTLHIEIFGPGEPVEYLTEDEQIERPKNDPRIERQIRNYHRSQFQPEFFRDVRAEKVHSEWLALRISVKKASEISKVSGNISPSAVTKGLKRFAKDIDMYLKDRRGRPQK